MPCRRSRSCVNWARPRRSNTLEYLYIIVVFEQVDDDTIRVVTAYEAPEPLRR